MRLNAIVHRLTSSKRPGEIFTIDNADGSEIAVAFQHMPSMAMLSIVAHPDGMLTLTYDRPGHGPVVSVVGWIRDDGSIEIHEPVLIPPVTNPGDTAP